MWYDCGVGSRDAGTEMMMRKQWNGVVDNLAVLEEFLYERYVVHGVAVSNPN